MSTPEHFELVRRDGWFNPNQPTVYTIGDGRLSSFGRHFTDRPVGIGPRLEDGSFYSIESIVVGHCLIGQTWYPVRGGYHVESSWPRTVPPLYQTQGNGLHHRSPSSTRFLDVNAGNYHHKLEEGWSIEADWWVRGFSKNHSRWSPHPINLAPHEKWVDNSPNFPVVVQTTKTFTPLPPKAPITHGVDWVAPSFTIEESEPAQRGSRLRKEIYKVFGETRTVQLRHTETCKHDKLLIPCALCQTKPRLPQLKPCFVGIGPQEFHAPWFKPQCEAHPFTVVPAHVKVERVPATPLGLQGLTRPGQFEGDCHMSHGITRKPTTRREGTFFCPECFKPVVVGYRTVQAGRPLWSVPMWDMYIDKAIYEVFGVIPTNAKRIKGRKINEFFTPHCNLGEYDLREPVIRATKGIYHKYNHRHVQSCVVFDKKHVTPVGYMVYRKIKTKGASA
ncbi:MAG TPA: hypothetical protein VJP02_25195 [Candidatus Sulfotelmatobacter sp.]|nr:hypothetical protein [Candidatus Sulfotelmatobacter sp.]